MFQTGAATLRPIVSRVRRIDDGVTLDLIVPADLAFFDGHFPSAPILPGVVQVAWAHALAIEHIDAGTDLGSVLRVKFKRIVAPGDALALTLRPKPERHGFDFEYADEKGQRSLGFIGRIAP